MELRIEQVDFASAPDSLLRALWEFSTEIRKELLPSDPPIPFEREVLDWANNPDSLRIDRYAGFDGDELVAVGLTYRDVDQNLDNGFARAQVRKDRRRQGIGRQLAARMVDDLAADDRKRLATEVAEGSPWVTWLEGLGLRMAIKEKVSRLDMGDVDFDEMDVWIERAKERASDYELLRFDTPIPDDVVEKYCELLFQMNTAPLDDYEMDDEVITPEIWRGHESAARSRKTNLSTLIAVHRPTGDFVGSTTVEFDEIWPEQAYQWETVVHPDHRNRGLGRWLKATMLKQVAENGTGVERIDTENAGSNEPMLNINVAMGFRPILVTDTWQGDLTKAQELLNA